MLVNPKMKVRATLFILNKIDLLVIFRGSRRNETYFIQLKSFPYDYYYDYNSRLSTLINFIFRMYKKKHTDFQLSLYYKFMKVNLFILSNFAGDFFQIVSHLPFMTVICVKQISPFSFFCSFS